MGKVKRNLLTSILLLVVMGIFAVLTIFVVVDAVNKKYYEDLNVEYEVQEEAPNIILTFARHEGSEVNNTTTKVVLNEEKDKFRLDGVVPEVTDGTVTNLDEITNENGGEFYFFSTNPAFINVQETPEDPNLIFNDTDIRYYVSTESNPIWYDVPTENVFTLYSVFLTPNVHNSDFANASLRTITNVIVSHDVVDIPYNAFSGSSSSRPSALTTVLLPETLQSIGDYSFQYCGNLISITIPEGVTSIGELAFDGCDSLQFNEYENGLYLGNEENPYLYLADTKITDFETFSINSKCKIIGSYAFRDCRSLTSIIIPSSVVSIGSSAFRYCSSLTSITIPSSVTSIGSYVFSGCISLTSITLPSSVTSIGDSAFSGCSSLTSITIPSSVVSIRSSAFIGCNSLTSITIPSSVTSIGGMAFFGCYKLVEVYNLSNLNITAGSGSNGYAGYYADYVYTSLDTPLIQQKVGDYIFYLYNGTMYFLSYTGNDTNLMLPSIEDVKKVFDEFTGNTYQIYERAFYENDTITGVTIPSSVTSIGEYAFSSCSSLTNITFEDNSQLESIGSRAFYNCNSLTSITISSSVTSIGSYAFQYCHKLVEIINLSRLSIRAGSNGYGYIGYYADYVYTSLDTPLKQQKVGDYVFYFDNDIMYLLSYTGNSENLILPSIEDVKKVFDEFTGNTYQIYEYAFYGNEKISSVAISSSVTSIGVYAFSDCSSLTSITIPESVTSIGDYAFSDCSSLTIYCEMESQPSGWDSRWNFIGGSVYWGLNVNWEYDEVTGEPRPI